MDDRLALRQAPAHPDNSNGGGPNATSAFKLQAIGELKLSILAIKTLISTLRNPAAELVYGGKGREDNPVAKVDVTMVCTVKKGASINIFKAGSPSEAIRTDILQERSEMEALCERRDGSVCVVVPGDGLGWVPPKFVERIEREPLESCRSQLDGWYDSSFDVSNTKPDVNDLLPLFSAIGRQFPSLAFDSDTFVRGNDGLLHSTYPYPVTHTVVQMIASHYVNLKRLSLNTALVAEISGLLDALDGDLGRRLRVLNLNGSHESFSDAFAEQLATRLAKTDDPLALQEVLLNNCGFGAQGLASLHEVLQVNRTLTVIELTGTKLLFRPGQELLRERERFDAVYQDQLLHASMPMEMKLAFLSVVGSNSQSDGKI